MTKVLAGITTSVDGFITGPDDGPGKGLGESGERLHYWVFGGPWTYESEATGEDAAWLAETISRVGAVVGGRWTYEAARHWGDENPWEFRSSSSRTDRRKNPRAARHVRLRSEGGGRASHGSRPWQGRPCHGRSRRHPPSVGGRAHRRAHHDHRAGHPRRGQARRSSSAGASACSRASRFRWIWSTSAYGSRST